MTTTISHDVTRMLQLVSSGDQDALAKLVPIVYSELRQLAARSLRRERGNHTLQPTALVHEAYLRLVNQRRAQWQNRAQFFAVAAEMMRRVLVDHARRHGAAKRAGGHVRVELDGAMLLTCPCEIDLLAVDQALGALAEFDPQQAKIVELRFFGGLTIEETAEVIGISPATVKREWTLAKAWLRREIDKDADS